MKSESVVRSEQVDVCSRYGVEPFDVPASSKVGIARNVLTDEQPLNGLRHAPVGDTTGWYIWAGGEPSQDADFFQPLHVEHLDNWSPAVQPYLLLPPGYRFLIAPGHEDVWFDPSLLEVED